MNSSIKQLFDIAEKPLRKVIGLMSGTSLDGLDIALCSISGSGAETKVVLDEFQTVPYNSVFKDKVKNIFSRRDADLQEVCLLHEWIGLQHGEMILSALAEWNLTSKEIDIIASHGQTIYHAPLFLHQKEAYPNGTLQIGDGDHIAVKTGIITVCDFRQKHLAAGGEGAPLAVYGDYLLFCKQAENRIMLNIGGIANFTYLPGDKDAHKVFSTDVGPGNTLMDQYVQKNFQGLYFDEGAQLASAGRVNPELLSVLLNHSFFNAEFPKTTGPELFNLEYLFNAQKQTSTSGLGFEDVMATLCRFSAEAIIKAIRRCFSEKGKCTIYMSGGGMHNPLLVSYLKSALPHFEFATTSQLNLNPDAKEAVLFAVLANETLAGRGVDFGTRQGVPSICMGKICLPN